MTPPDQPPRHHRGLSTGQTSAKYYKDDALAIQYTRGCSIRATVRLAQIQTNSAAG